MHKKLNVFIILFSAYIALSGVSAQNEAGLQKAVDGDTLMAIVRDEGTIRIIVKAGMPDINKLTAASNAHRVRKFERHAVQEALKADAKLSDAISSIADRAISQLQDRGLSFEINHTYAALPLIAMNSGKAFNAIMKF